MRRFVALVVAVLLFPPAVTAGSLQLKPVRVGDGIYAVVGDLGGQTYENDGLNANLGFVIGRDGVLVVNSGPTRRVAEALHRAIQSVTDRPVRWVVNVNSQNHYWHGNDYFAKQGATVIAHEKAVEVMRDSGVVQRDGNRRSLKEKARGTMLAYPTRTFKDSHVLDLGGRTAELRHFGQAHTPGDIAVWLPKERILFSGDIVYTERLLAVIPISDHGKWLQAYDRLSALRPAVIVPGHGRPTTMARADRETRAYLNSLREQARKAFERGDSLKDAVNRIDQSKFRHLANFDLLARRNANEVYRQIEKELF